MKYTIKKFKDHQVAATIIEEGDLHVNMRGNTYEDLFKAASIKEAWDAILENKNKLATLTIYCLIGQRSDRRFHENESFDLKVISKFINSMNFNAVKILHPHSSVSLALIDNASEINSFEYVQKAFHKIGTPVLISPDAGAYKTTHEMAEKLKGDIIPSNKIRIDGVPQIKIQGDVKNKTCLLVDDLADGGRTFKLLADELRKQGANNVFLYVTHGQFNYGFEELKKNIKHIFCTNSYKDIQDDFVTQYKVI